MGDPAAGRTTGRTFLSMKLPEHLTRGHAATTEPWKAEIRRGKGDCRACEGSGDDRHTIAFCAACGGTGETTKHEHTTTP